MIYLLLCLYAYKHGQTNAFLYSLKGANALPRNEHVDLVIERIIVGGGIIIGFCYGYAGLGIELTAEIIAAILAFSFWHNGAYYVMREKIRRNGAKLNQWDFRWHWMLKSKSSTARFDFSYKQRLTMKVASFGVLIAGYTAPLWWPYVAAFYAFMLRLQIRLIEWILSLL